MNEHDRLSCRLTQTTVSPIKRRQPAQVVKCDACGGWVRRSWWSRFLHLFTCAKMTPPVWPWW